MIGVRAQSRCIACGDSEHAIFADFNTTPQPALKGRQIAMSRGKGLGGSSAINNMGMLRAPAIEYDRA